MKPTISRRHFLETASLTGAALSVGLPTLASGAEATADKPAKLGGQPLCSGFPDWPVFDQTEEKALLDTLKSGHWYRGSGSRVSHFEDAYEALTGAKHCLATASGTA